MFVSIDWVSFTLPLPEEPTFAAQADDFSRAILRSHAPSIKEWLYDFHEWEYTTGRAPYRYGFRRADGGAMVFSGSNTGTVLYEVSGRGCKDLGKLSDAQAFMYLIANHLTRIDIACDMECETKPSDFVNARTKAKGLSIGFQQSPTGETVYLGSMKSDRYCRVYRYSAPHPRSHLLRFEAVYRRDYAKALGWAITEVLTWSEVAKLVGDKYGWTSPDWRPAEYTAVELTMPRATRNEDKTVHWLYRTVAPALGKLMANDAISLPDFLKEVYKHADDHGGVNAPQVQ